MLTVYYLLHNPPEVVYCVHFSLFWVSPDLLQRPIYKAFVDMLDNYILNTGTADDLTSAEWAEIDTFISLIKDTSVIEKCRAFLESKGK